MAVCNVLPVVFLGSCYTCTCTCFICLRRVRRTLSKLDSLKSGNLTQPLIQELQEVIDYPILFHVLIGFADLLSCSQISVNVAWPEDSGPPPSSSPFKNDTTLCDSRQWLCQHGLAGIHVSFPVVFAYMKSQSHGVMKSGDFSITPLRSTNRALD